jgi:hypothetical protein
MNNFFKMQFYSGLLLKLKNKCKHLYISTIKKKETIIFFSIMVFQFQKNNNKY